MTLKEFKKYAIDLDCKRLSAMPPAKRREILQRRENDRKIEEEKAKSTVPYLEHEREINNLEQTIDFISDDFHKYANLSLDALKSKQKDLEKARARIDALLDANIKLQEVKRHEIEEAARKGAKSGVAKSLADLQAKANEIQSEARKAATLGRDCKRELQAAKKTLTNIGEDAEAARKAAQAAAQGIGETSTGVQALLALLPDDEEWKAILAELRKRIGEKPVSALSQPKAAKILKLLDQATFSSLTGRTVGNWLKRGEMPKYPRFKISQANLDGGAAGFVAYIAGQYQVIGSPLKLDPATMKAILAIDGKGSGPA